MKKFKGFTLSEVMISLTVISVIMLFYIPVHKTVTQQYTTLGYSAFENLNAVAKELMSGHAVDDGSEHLTATQLSANGKLILNTTDTAFCKNFFDVMNTVGTPNCTTFYTISKSNAGNPLTYKLAGINPVDANYRNFTTNGHRYFLSAHQAQDNLISTEYGYRIIGVDITGKKSPNISDPYPETPQGKPADLIYFILLDDGRVFPIGVAATNRNYINTRTDAYFYDQMPEGVHKAMGCKSYGAPWEYNNNQKVANTTTGAVTGECTFGIASSVLSGQTTYSYQAGYCFKDGDTTDFKGYNCAGNSLSQDPYCAAGGGATECHVKLIKPIYRVKI